MKPKTVTSLLAVVAILSAASYFLFNSKSTDKQENNMGTELIQNLPVNDITGIKIVGNENIVELKRGPDVWLVKNRYDYPADFDKIVDLIKKLDRLKIGRTFKAGNDVLARQKLYAPDDDQAKADQQGTRVILSNDNGEVLTDLILGSSRQGSSNGGGQYIRFADKMDVYLVNDNFTLLKITPQDWLEREAINLDAQDIKMVTSYAGNSNQPLYRLERRTRGQKPQLISPPAKKEVDTTKIDLVFDALAPLNVDDIIGPSRNLEDPLPEYTNRLEYHAYDGKTITVYPSSTPTKDQKDGQYFATLTVSYTLPETPAEEKSSDNDKKEPAQEGSENKIAKDNGADNNSDVQEKSPQEIEKDAQALNDKLRVWTYQIAKWQYDSFITAQEGLLKTKEDNPPQ